MRLFSYIVTYDTGFAPNPFFGYCTLACCKPKIRQAAQPQDWVVGLSPKSLGNKLVYAMKVEEKLTFQNYWSDPRFDRKKPDCTAGKVVHKCGDNIYQPLPHGHFRQLRSMHSHGNSEDCGNKNRDLGGGYV